ncbi:SDR family oxidoreductase [Sporosarcina sp. ANT_H38]|uniref:SDR family oxidoreductase n=1 Tax=Sporosarcina sp. ANT_H38 TaxID=2597358 RepID=UPI0011F13DF9|nr:SDR family oxidoreductase [Sporosarcina sp. ANT_H38]KAA0966688.1 SDR family oxidoreductase [Sporosarcina sp. ANT_H38]
MKTHLFTGFPGFIATQLIKELIRTGKVEKIYTVVQSSQVELAKEKATSIMNEMNIAFRFEIVVGDITKPGLGMDQQMIKELHEETLTIWHLAAIYDLAVKAAIAWQVNVEGTRQVVEFVRNHPSIERFMYFSTAYVAGKREGKLLETELIRPNSFKNHYEETKFEAELLVEELKKESAVTIIRPGIVRGHSTTGETIKFDGPYFFMNMIDKLRWMPIIPYVGKTKACINVVPIDYIINATVYLSNHEAAVSHTVHLTDPAPHPIEEIYCAMVVELTGKKPKGRLPRFLAERGLSSIRLQRTLGVEAETLDYMMWDASFDTTVAERLLEGSGIVCADFIKSIPSMTAFYEKNKKKSEFHIKIG